MKPTITREWAMPNPNTFSIHPIRRLISRAIYGAAVVVDPFARNNAFATISNDLDKTCDTTYHMEATDFLRMLPDDTADVVLYDPPYSARQIAECYKRLGRSVSWRDTTSAYWCEQKKEIARIVKPGGLCLTFAWNSGGIGQSLGFEIEEILLVAHGGWHNDTIATVERKRKNVAGHDATSEPTLF